MATIRVFRQDSEPAGEIEVDDGVFGLTGRDHLIHLVVRKQLAARRQGTAAVKHRSDISGGGKKPWKQKGTGRARQGSSRSPQWRGGGVVFGPMPRSYDFKVNKKQMRAALCAALSRRVASGDAIVLEDLAFDAPKTRQFAELMDRFGLSNALFVIGDKNPNVELASRNLPSAKVLLPIGVNVYDVLLRPKLVLTRAGVEALLSRLGAA